MANIILPAVPVLSNIDNTTKLVVEQDGEINRYPIADLDIGGGDVTIDLSPGGISAGANSINADTLGGYAANDYIRHEEFNKNILKAGFIYPSASSVVPEGFLLCDGKAYMRTEYPELFAAIGTMYGNGDGSTTFNVPNLQTRVPIGSGEGYEIGATGGEEIHTLTIDEMPSHNHYEKISIAGTGTDLYITGAGNLTNAENSYVLTGESRTGREYQATDSTGGDQPHNNMQPYTVVNYIIATGKNTGASVSDIVLGAQAIPLGIEYGGTGATSITQARKNLEITPDNIGAMSMELLWENASPNSNFAAQTINVDLSAYTMARVVFKNGLSFDYNILEQKYDYTNLLMLSDSTTHWGYRKVSVSASEVTFGDGSLSAVGGTFGTNNAVAIPTKIYGIKGVL